MSSSAEELPTNVNALATGGRVLVVTPYSPAVVHGHAADEIGPRLFEALAALCELHVFAPHPDGGSPAGPRSVGYKLHHGSSPSPTIRRHLGAYPALGRKDWSRANTREAVAIFRALQPAWLHVEYVQPLECALAVRHRAWSMTMHDITERVCRQRAQAERQIVRRPYYFAEYLRVRRLERRALRAAGRVFTLSERDTAWARRFNEQARTLTLGRSGTEQRWEPRRGQSPVFVFAGAMWRDANVRSACYLADEVMPHVWRSAPDATLRLVGARPAPQVLARAVDPRIVVAGEVPSFLDEYLSADAVLAPSLVDAGVLVKAIQALECGAPLVMNRAAAEPLGAVDGRHVLVRETAESVAEALLGLWQDNAYALELGAAGRELAERRHTWGDVAAKFIAAIGDRP